MKITTYFCFSKFARNVDFVKVSTAIPSNWTWSANGIFSELLTVNMFEQLTSVVLKCLNAHTCKDGAGLNLTTVFLFAGCKRW